MGSEVYKGMRHVPGWLKLYIHNINQGDSDTAAASRAQVSSVVVQKRYDGDPVFAAEYDKAVAARAKNPNIGRRSW